MHGLGNALVPVVSLSRSNSCSSHCNFFRPHSASPPAPRRVQWVVYSLYCMPTPSTQHASPTAAINRACRHGSVCASAKALPPAAKLRSVPWLNHSLPRQNRRHAIFISLDCCYDGTAIVWQSAFAPRSDVKQRTLTSITRHAAVECIAAVDVDAALPKIPSLTRHLTLDGHFRSMPGTHRHHLCITSGTKSPSSWQLADAPLWMMLGYSPSTDNVSKRR